MEYLLGGIAGLVFGGLVAFLNSRLTKRYMRQQEDQTDQSMLPLMKLSVSRQIFALAALAIAFLLRNVYPWPFVAVICGTAVGLTVVSFLFLYRLTRK